MSLFSLFQTSKLREIDGVWLQYGVTADGAPIRIKIGRAGGGNIAFSKALDKAVRPHKRAIQVGALDEKVAEKLMHWVYAETVVLDWENVERKDGTVLPFTRANVLLVFEELPDLFKDIQVQAAELANFREMVREGDLGNS